LEIDGLTKAKGLLKFAKFPEEEEEELLQKEAKRHA